MKRFTIGASDALTLCAIVLLLSCPSVAKGQQEPAAPPRPVCIDAQSPSFQYRDIVNEGSPDRATKRYAVVIGNAMYTNGLGPLPKAAADASEVSRALSSAGFTVYCLLNLDRGSMTNLISVMVDEIPEKSEILFYYAGHGFSRNGENYLLPLINFEIRRDKDLEELGFAESVVLDYLLITKPNYLVLLLDACRGELLIPKEARSTSPGCSGQQM
jgi:Caspase domain